MKIYFSKYFNDYIFVIGGQAYFFFSGGAYTYSICMAPIWNEHLKSSRMRKPKEHKEVIYICTVKDN